MKITNKYVLFWDGIFSQWYKVPMTIDGIEYNCAEQYMMHQKALLFGDKEIAAEVMKITNPKDHKALGRKVKGYDEAIWKRNCLAIVYKGNYAKFTQNKELEQQLVNTGARTIVEASPVDFIWGIERAENDPLSLDPAQWKGTNLLGSALMLVRNEIMN
jgi:ribA/ribD-fused uncharacterized protein